MVKSKKESATIVEAAPVSATKPSKKSKRDAEVDLDIKTNPKKQKKELIQAEKKSPTKKVEISSSSAPMKKQPETLKSSSTEDESSSSNQLEIMRTGRQTYKATTLASLLPETLTMKPIVQAPCLETKENHRSKKKKKCITGLCDLNIPSELLQDILSRLGPRDNIKSSAVCKTWFEAAVSVRKLYPLPWLFHLPEGGDYTLFDPSNSQSYERNFPELKGHEPVYSREGWLLMARHGNLEFFFNPFTRERISLPNRSAFFSGKCLAFSAPPTSTSCLVISFQQFGPKDPFVVATWRPGETVWTIHRFRNRYSILFGGKWHTGVFSNGLFYGFNTGGYVGVFNPSKATWDVLPVRSWSCPAFCQIVFERKEVLMMEQNGNIFVFSIPHKRKSHVFKLNLERMEWEEMSKEGCGLTVFTSWPAYIRRSNQNRTYPSISELRSQYYSLVHEKCSPPLTSTSFHTRVAWVDPPPNNFTF